MSSAVRRAPLRAVAALALLLGGCSSDLATPGEALRVVGASLPGAYVGEAYDEPVHAVGGLRPYAFELVEGALPPGLSLEAGTLRGTPEQTGDFAFTVQVSDANLSKTVQRYALRVAAVPPPRLTFDPPLTQVQRRITLHARLADARHLQGIRSEVRWDATRFRLVDGSVQPSMRGVALLFDAQPGQLRVAVAPLGTTLDGAMELLHFELEPVDEPSTLELTARTEAVSDGRRDVATTREGRAPTAGGASTTPSPPGGNQPGSDKPESGLPGSGIPGLGLPDPGGDSQGAEGSGR